MLVAAVAGWPPHCLKVPCLLHPSPAGSRPCNQLLCIDQSRWQGCLVASATSEEVAAPVVKSQQHLHNLPTHGLASMLIYWSWLCKATCLSWSSSRKERPWAELPCSGLCRIWRHSCVSGTLACSGEGKTGVLLLIRLFVLRESKVGQVIGNETKHSVYLVPRCSTISHVLACHPPSFTPFCSWSSWFSTLFWWIRMFGVSLI